MVAMLVQNPKLIFEPTSHLRNSNLQVTRQKTMKIGCSRHVFYDITGKTKPMTKQFQNVFYGVVQDVIKRAAQKYKRYSVGTNVPDLLLNLTEKFVRRVSSGGFRPAGFVRWVLSGGIHPGLN